MALTFLRTTLSLQVTAAFARVQQRAPCRCSGLQIFLLVTPMYDVGVNYFCFFVAAKVLDVLHSKCQDSYNPMDLVSS